MIPATICPDEFILVGVAHIERDIMRFASLVGGSNSVPSRLADPLVESSRSWH